MTESARAIENRKEIYNKYVEKFGSPPSFVKRIIVEYDRYHEADLVINALKKSGVDFEHLKVLDFGCGAGDYGISFARLGAKVYFYDDESMLNIIKIRLGFEPIVHVQLLNYNDAVECPKVDMVIFGEVLEHLNSPLNTLKQFIENDKCKYIMTSSYPYRSDNPKDPYWNHGGHTKEAFNEQPKCREILEKNYKKYRLDGQLNIWIKK